MAKSNYEMTLLDYFFFLVETEQSPKHIGMLMTLDKPEGSSDSFVHDMYERWLQTDTAVQPFNLKLNYSMIGLPHWEEVDDFDPANHCFYHRKDDGASKEFLYSEVCVAHSKKSAYDKPHWEIHLIDNLANNQFGMYIRMHHAYMDGISIVGMTVKMFSKSAEELNCEPLWVKSFDTYDEDRPKSVASLLVKKTTDLVKNRFQGLYGLTRVASQLSLESLGLTHNAVTVPFKAERSILTSQVREGREMATIRISLKRMFHASKLARATLNHVMLACVDGAMHRYLEEIGSPLDGPLVISMPVSLREDIRKLGGNAVGTVPVELAENTDDPLIRIKQIGATLKAVRNLMDDSPKPSITAYTLATLTLPQVAELCNLSNKIANLSHMVISNVPGPRDLLYLDGARLEEVYPISALQPGQNLNLSMLSYGGYLNFGALAVKDSLPNLNRFMELIVEEFNDLEAILQSPDLGIELVKQRRKAKLSKGK